MTRASIPSLLVAAGLAAGCTDYRAQRAAQLNALVGQPETVVVAQLGVPSRTYEAAGHKYLAYVESRSDVIGGGFFGGGFGYGYGGFGGFGGLDAFPAEIIPRTCQTSFDVVGGRVQAWALHGNAC